MRILSIASILPVPEIYQENDIVFKFNLLYTQVNSNDRVQIWRPSAYSNVIFASLNPKWKIYYQVLRKGDFECYGFNVKILPFFDLKASPSTRAMLAKSIWTFNKSKIKQDLNEFNPDIVHAQWLFPDGWLAYKLKKEFNIPYVITLRKETDFYTDPKTRNIALKITNEAEYVSVLNFRMKRQLRESGFKGKVQLIPHGIEAMFFEHQAKPDTERKTGPAIITVTRFLDMKYLDRLIKVLSILAKKYTFTYTLVGTGPEESKLKALVSELQMQKQIKIKQPVPHEEIPALLADHDVFAMTSYPETFGRVYFEAMATGLPIICSKNSGIDGFFTNGEAGYFVDHQSIEDIAEKLEILLKNPKLRKQTGQNGRKLVQQYKWSDIVTKYSDIYKNAILSNENTD